MRNRAITVVVAAILLLANIATADINQGLVAWYRLDGNGADASGNVRDGTLWGATAAEDRFGNAGGALGFDGLNDYVALPDNSPTWLPRNDFTVSAWVYFNANPRSNSHDFILDLDFTYWTDPTRSRGYCILRQWGTGKAQFQMQTSAADVLISDDILAKEAWYHFVGVRNGSTQAIFLDGQLAASATCSSEAIDFSTPSDDNKASIGKFIDTTWTSGTYFLNGRVDDVRIYDRALSAQEIGQLYNVPEPMSVGILALGAALVASQREKHSRV